MIDAYEIPCEMSARAVLELGGYAKTVEDAERLRRYKAAVLPQPGEPRWVGPPAVVVFGRMQPPRLRDGTRRLAALVVQGCEETRVPVVLRVRLDGRRKWPRA